jgi:hypothetical protein
VQRWGEPRLTVDVDLTLITGFGNEPDFVSAFTKKFRTRRPDAVEFALDKRVLLLLASNDVPLDIALAGLPFEERSVTRASPWKISEDTALVTCSAEDLIVHKAFADRPQDWLDVQRILQRQRVRLNLNLIFEELRPLIALKEAPEIEDRLRKMIEDEKLSG